jgi:hypothetical protein
MLMLVALLLAAVLSLGAGLQDPFHSTQFVKSDAFIRNTDYSEAIRKYDQSHQQGGARWAH